MKAEILAPAGNEECLNAAFAAGADAVYFGLPLFGARAYARNFTLEEAGEMIRKAHLAGKKVYITMNTLLEESQMEQAFDWARQLYEYGVDALILQDLGFIHLLHQRLPELELHASTQLSVSTPEQIEKLRQLGISRVVLAREATLDEIEACAKTGMELEVFIHGALCISYSGQCQFSRVRYARSGNKGACAQPCRMEYQMLENGRPVGDLSYLLSPKDLSLMEQIPQLEKAGVASLKIEGRMKSPEYVYESVLNAKKVRDGKKITKQDEKDLKTAFNRGYTKGHTYQKMGLDLMNPKSGNHQGIPLGKVISVSKDKVKIALDDDLNQNDGIRFVNKFDEVGCHANFIFDKKGKLINGAKAGDTVEVKVSKKVYPGAQVRKTSSALLEKKVADEVAHAKVQSPVFLNIIAHVGQPIVLEASDGVHTVSVSGQDVQEARKSASSLESLKPNLMKTGDTWARVDKVSGDVDANAFVPASWINDLRRQAIAALEKEKVNVDAKAPLDYTFKAPKPDHEVESYIEIMKKDQAGNTDLMQVSEFPFAGVHKKANIRQDDGEFGAHLSNGKIVEDLNVTNSYAMDALLALGYEGALLSNELSEQGRKDMLAAFKERNGFDAPVIATVYEKPRLMVMKHCPVNTLKKDGTRTNCSLCRQNTYEIEGKDGKKAFLYGDSLCDMQIFDEVPVNKMDEIPQLEQEGIHAFRMLMTNEDADQAASLYKQFEEKLKNKGNTADCVIKS